MLSSVKYIFIGCGEGKKNFVYWVFVSFIANELLSKYKRWRDIVMRPVQKFAKRKIFVISFRVE